MSAVVFLNKDIYLNFEDGYFYKCYMKLEAHLKPQENNLLKLLVSHSGTVCTYEYIYDCIYSERNVVHVSIRSIKSWFERLNLRDDYICTISGIGYSFSSGYHVVELLETAPNIIEPLTLKDNFVEEPELLDKIFNAFEEGNKVVFLSGISGSGKSELARSFSSRYKNTFYSALHFALTPDGNGSFEDLIAENDKFFWDTGFEKDQKIKVRKEVLKKLGKESLIIIDNFNCDKNLDFLNDVCGFVGGIRPTGAAKILITSTLSGNAFANYLPYGCKVIEVEKERDKKQLAYDILARKAGISESENKDIEAIVRAIGYHPLCSAIIGAQIKEYDLDMAYLKDIFSRDLKKALTSGESVFFRKDNINADFKPYEILKYIFKNVSKKLTEIERQVLGAYLLLPKLHHKPEALSEFVGDIRCKCSRAKGAVRILQKKCLMEIDKDGTIILHPLLEQLFQDSEFLENGTTVAELSDGFRIHLLNNFFVSEYNDEKNKLNGVFFDRKYTSFDEQGNTVYVLKGMFSKLLDFSSCIRTKNAGWVLSNKRKKDDFCSEEISELVESININQRELGLKDRIDEEILYDMIDSPKNNALYFVVEYKKGLSVFLYDYNNQKEYCVINCSEQIKEQNRYFDKNSTSAQAGVPIKSVFVGSFGDHLPEAFVIPEHICGIETRKIYRKTEDPFKKETDEMKYLLIPKTVETIGDYSFANFSNLQCVAFGNSQKLNIENFSFSKCEKLKHIFLPSYPCRLGVNAFNLSPIDEVVVPKGTVASIAYNLNYQNSLDEMLVDGYYYQEEYNFDAEKKFNEVDELMESLENAIKRLPGEPVTPKKLNAGYAFKINDIYGNWYNKGVVYDASKRKQLDWNRFFEKWIRRINNNARYFDPSQIALKTVTFGQDLIFDKKTEKAFEERVLILTQEPAYKQLSWLDVIGTIDRIRTPFYPRNRQIFIAETQYDHALEDSSWACGIHILCEREAKKDELYGDCKKSNEYRRFAESFLQERPDLFQDFGEDEDEE